MRHYIYIYLVSTIVWPERLRGLWGPRAVIAEALAAAAAAGNDDPAGAPGFPSSCQGSPDTGQGSPATIQGSPATSREGGAAADLPHVTAVRANGPVIYTGVCLPG
eukprot:4816206-Pyramimonas_sp.AAC.1